MAQCPTAEVHFHDDRTCSCVIRSGAKGDDLPFDELLLWACFANHQMNNMGRDARAVAASLQSVSENDLGRYAQRGAEGFHVLAEHPGPAKKNFIGTIQQLQGGQRFHLKMNGFGLLGRGLGFYVPSSIIALLLHMARRRIENKGFVRCLRVVANTCGYLVLARLLNLRNASQMAMEAVTCAVAEVTREADEATTDD